MSSFELVDDNKKNQNYQRIKCLTKLGQWKIFYDQKEKTYLIKSRDLNQIEDLISLQLGEQEKQYLRHKQTERKMNQPTQQQQERRNRFFQQKQIISELGQQLDVIAIEDEKP
ncbi:hypothetical protein TTHERM_00726090 (macronuclear) [Tetrahymena thermophila SB210]|uniref:Uncharacterized protein n=1 Tax=Tetrahymena thermophila (strain SB210) TaxID=312017 RepID=Q24GI1_TETTS|nr:hypothetical protein TTHERM_00726090 [Tetrahymena thermophila SB210]EAS06890.3 hypothetical protein TTHERM_00726090 [Tetrahymena thermophila SB210]|eukprot:XP_001027132.3 hypothetical protein TTHERM_00726090 [Tetrahymena thermophila SB210]